MSSGGEETAGPDYARRLERLTGMRWKRVLDVQAPYRWNIRQLNLGRTLDIGCGIGRNLAHLDGNAVGVDHNATAVETARRRGLTAFTGDQFAGSDYARPGAFDSLLLAHVVEHVGEREAVEIISDFLGYLRPRGRVVFICPQERGYATDATHVRFCDFDDLAHLAGLLDLHIERRFSFPFPRAVGKLFPYNEFVLIARKR